MSTSATYEDPDAVPKSSWLGVIAITLGAFALVVMEFLPVGLLPGVINGFGVSEGTAGLMVTATAALGFIAAPVTALSVGRLDRRIVLLMLTGLVVVSGVMSAAAPNFSILVIARAILGAGVGGFWSVSITAAARLVSKDQVHKASSLVFSGISVASVVGVPLGSYISSHYDWRFAFIVATALAASVFLLQLFTLPKIAMDHGAKASDFIELLKSRKIVAIYLTIVFMVAGHFAGYTFLSPYLHQLGGFKPNAISALLLVFGIVAVAGNFLGGTLAGRHLHGTVYGNVVLFLASLIAVATFPHDATILIVSLVGWAVSWGMAPVGTQLWLYGATQHAPEAAQSLNTSVFQLSITLGSLAGGVAVDQLSLHAATWTGVVVLVLAAVMVTIVGRLDSMTPGGA